MTTPDTKLTTWRTFTASHDEADARRIFTERHGYKPEMLFRAHGLIWVGPVKG